MQINVDFVDELEIEELILYQHVMKNIKRHTLKHYVSLL